MQLLQAGSHQMVLLDFDSDLLRQGAEELGLECTVEQNPRHVLLELSQPDRPAPLLLFDAAEPANLGWFSRCQFYVDAHSGAVLQTPFTLANSLDASGRPHPRALKVQVRRELPVSFRMPGRQAVTEKVLYGVLFNFLGALLNSGVGICGRGIVKPLAGRGDAPAL